MALLWCTRESGRDGRRTSCMRFDRAAAALASQPFPKPPRTHTFSESRRCPRSPSRRLQYLSVRGWPSRSARSWLVAAQHRPPRACEEAKGRRGDVRKVLAVRVGGERDMREGAGGLRGGALCGRGEHLCRGRPALGLPIAADGVDGGEGRRRGCSGRRSPRAPRSSSGDRSVVSPTSLFSKLGRPPAARRGCGPDLGDQISNLRPAARADEVRILQ